jgi:transcriptional regulator with XRE-family HTH domain
MDKNDEIIDARANRGHQGFAIKCIRGLRDMKQVELGELIGVSESQMYKIEKKAIIEGDKLEKIAKALKVDVDTIKNFRTDCEIRINTFNDSAKNFEPQSANTDNYGVPVDKYETMVNKVIESEKIIAQKDLEIQELKFRLSK